MEDLLIQGLRNIHKNYNLSILGSSWIALTNGIAFNVSKVYKNLQF
jgi:hypothetical protein